MSCDSERNNCDKTKRGFSSDSNRIRFERHGIIGKAFRASMTQLGLEMVPENEMVAANTLSAVYFPENCDGATLLSDINQAGVIVAGGLLKTLKRGYFRVGHRGSVGSGEILSTVSTIESTLQKGGYSFALGSGVREAQKILTAR